MSTSRKLRTSLSKNTGRASRGSSTQLDERASFLVAPAQLELFDVVDDSSEDIALIERRDALAWCRAGQRARRARRAS